MPILIRKFSRAKWEIAEEYYEKDYPADAITGCLRTKGNTLSTWKIESESKIDEAVLAIVTGPKNDELETIDIILLDQAYIEKNNIKLKENGGLTAYKDMINNHLDLIELSYKKLGAIAEHYIQLIKNDKCKRYSKSDLLKIMKNGIEQEKIEFEKLHKNLQEEILKKIPDIKIKNN